MVHPFFFFPGEIPNRTRTRFGKSPHPAPIRFDWARLDGANLRGELRGAVRVRQSQLLTAISMFRARKGREGNPIHLAGDK